MQQPSFNRTIVGLKLKRYEGKVDFTNRFNRTIVGLKLRCLCLKHAQKSSFNRTIVGLKYDPSICNG